MTPGSRPEAAEEDDMLMRLKRKIGTMAYGPTGEGRPELLGRGEFAMPVGPLPSSGFVDAMTIAGLVRIPVDCLEKDAGQPVPQPEAPHA